MPAKEDLRVDDGEQHCVLIEPADPRLKEATKVSQAILASLQELGWEYGETRESGTLVKRRFVSEQDFLHAFEEAAAVVGSRAILQEVPCESIY